MDEDKQAFLIILIPLGIRVLIFVPLLIYAHFANPLQVAQDVGLTLLVVAVPFFVYLYERRLQ